VFAPVPPLHPMERGSGGEVHALLLLLLVCLSFPVAAQDTVTIPKSRLEELERKEAELEKLKGALHTAKGENVQLQKQHQEDAARIASVPIVIHVSPPMTSLHTLTE